jgi:uncharacterized phage protein gp47/JayE
MTKKDVHVTPRTEGGWSVQRSNAQRASSVHETQAEAENEGRRLARQDGVEFNLHGRNGRVREKDSYGNDPNPPRG